MKETEVWDRLSRSWKPKVCSTRIENITSFGVPDVNCAMNEREWWLELKVERNGYTEIKPTQVAWIAMRVKTKSNRNVFILIAEEKTYTASLFDSMEIFRPGVIVTGGGKTRLNIREMVSRITIDILHHEGWNDLLAHIISCLHPY